MTIAMRFCLLFAMIWCHAYDEFHLQGTLAQMKREKWWIRNIPYTNYEHDYIAALIMHSMAWSFSILIPILVAKLILTAHIWMSLLPIVYVLNAIIHGIADDALWNRMSINLWQTQCINITQIVITWALLIF